MSDIFIREQAYQARINIGQDDGDFYHDNMCRFLSVAGRLKIVDITPPAQGMTKEKLAPWREDVVEDSLTQEKALLNCPTTEEGFFVVPTAMAGANE